MSDHLLNSIVSVSLAIIGVAVIAVLVSKSAKTTDVMKSVSGSLSKMICVALSPVTGGGCTEQVDSIFKPL